MDLDRRTVFELSIAAFVIVVFTGGAYYVSSAYASPGNGTNESIPPSVQPEGGLALVAVIAVFILVVAATGLFMYWQDFDDDE